MTATYRKHALTRWKNTQTQTQPTQSIVVDENASKCFTQTTKEEQKLSFYFTQKLNLGHEMNSVTVLSVSSVFLLLFMKFARSSDLCQQKVECPQLTSRKGEKSCESSWCNWISISMLRCYLRKIYTVLKAGNRKKRRLVCVDLCSIHFKFVRREKRREVTISIAVVVTSHLFLKSFEISFVVVFAIQSYEKNCLSFLLFLPFFCSISMSAYCHLDWHATFFWREIPLGAVLDFFVTIAWLWFSINNHIVQWALKYQMTSELKSTSRSNLQCQKFLILHSNEIQRKRNRNEYKKKVFRSSGWNFLNEFFFNLRCYCPFKVNESI